MQTAIINAQSPAASPELEAVHAAAAEVAKRRAAAAEARKAREADPAVQLAEAKVALAREKAAADLEEHELEADRLYLGACVLHGEDRVGRIHTRLGSIVIRYQGEAEIEAQEKRAEAHRDAAKKAKTKAEADMCEKNARTAMEEGFCSALLTSRAHFDRVTSTGPGIWPVLWRARNALIDASVLAEGKADAR